MIELGNLVRSERPFTDYRLIKWTSSYDASEQTQQKLLSFIENGGALVAASTPWGYLQVYPNKTLADMSLYNFLKNFMGILFTADCLWFPADEMLVAENRAKHSHFNMALDKVTNNPNKIGKYLSTINSGIGQLNKEGILGSESILNLKDIVIIECQNSGWNPIPAKDKPVRTSNEKNATILLGQCFNFTEGYLKFIFILKLIQQDS